MYARVRLFKTPPSPTAPLPVRRPALGHPALDAALGGGLAHARLHEARLASPGDGASTLGFALLLAGLIAGPEGAIPWITEDAAERRTGALYGPGLVDLGPDPARLLLVRVPDEQALLRTAGDVARSPAVAATVVAPAGRAPALDLTASRRHTLFAERSGATVLLVRAADRTTELGRLSSEHTPHPALVPRGRVRASACRASTPPPCLCPARTCSCIRNTARKAPATAPPTTPAATRAITASCPHRVTSIKPRYPLPEVYASGSGAGW